MSSEEGFGEICAGLACYAGVFCMVRHMVWQSVQGLVCKTLGRCGVVRYGLVR